MQTHGHARRYQHSREYMTWCDMKKRCENPKDRAYKRYGGRGITVCDRWQSFENFLEDMGQKPVGLSLERKENDKGYSPDNCIWATRIEQANNTRFNRPITFKGETLTMSQWGQQLGMSPQRLYYRLNHWPIERALQAPRHKS